ncbi:arsinothricin resistance N-acetyltransferase ArsN1 family A [Peribacillus simplex]|uniref:arsinothricin resistance N-acetyltransferase ArsN1 family A n=1 Tax=Peribacillus simplex TaxID=1478 RepID=UPI00298DF4B4|nr:arsinothricin resistance N-acetyltransferase ArsN1 family A [Peribacillus simplex]MDW7617353.1 arsinothricin resistance N-acetyltransferase ArsN1 family A [Peribacillus simplex]
MGNIIIRKAVLNDLEFILQIYNQGIKDKIATLETETKDIAYMSRWFEQHQDRYQVIVAEHDDQVVGWASLNPYNNRCSYAGVADLSIYISRSHRGKGIGGMLLSVIEKKAKEFDFHKIVLFTFPFNQLGQGLYRKYGYREVGVFNNQGIMDGKFIDVMAMEKLLGEP